MKTLIVLALLAGSALGQTSRVNHNLYAEDPTWIDSHHQFEVCTSGTNNCLIACGDAIPKGKRNPATQEKTVKLKPCTDEQLKREFEIEAAFTRYRDRVRPGVIR